MRVTTTTTTTTIIIRKRAIALVCGAALVACSLTLPFDELGNGVHPAIANDADPLDTFSPRITDAAATDERYAPPELKVDAASNPTAGFGIFAMHMVALPDAGPGLVSPVRVEPTDGGLGEIGCAKPDLLDQGRAGALYGAAVHYDKTNPAHALFLYPHIPTDNTAYEYFLATEATSCSAADAPPLRYKGNAIAPSFSDDGTRFALIVSVDGKGGKRIVTLPTSGAIQEWPLRDITQWQGGAITIARPAWFTDQTTKYVLWDEVTPKKENVVRIAADLTLPTLITDPDTYPSIMRCAPEVGDIRQIDLMRFGGKLVLGFVLAAAPKQVQADGGPATTILSSSDIYLADYPPVCTARVRLFKDAPAESASNDFAISPDGNYLAHQTDRAEAAGGATKPERSRIWIGDASGNRTQCSHPTIDKIDIGPVWIANGTQVGWTRIASDQQLANADLVIADVKDGKCSNERLLTNASGPNAYFSARSGTCAIGPNRTSRTPLALIGAALLVSAMRRYRRSRIASGHAGTRARVRKE